MRKQTKIAAVVSAAALLALGASITSFAASKGTWMMVDGEWYCYDKNGDVYENTFCSSNGKDYYVGDDGALVRSSWVEYDGEYYFVNSSGAKIINDWRLTTPYDDEDADEEWYYFQSTGKRAENKKILYKGHTYFFDSDGEMLTGWVTYDSDGTASVDEANDFNSNKTFYADETGARLEKSWIKTTEPGVEDDDADADEYYYWFKSSGKAQTGKATNVNGQTYLFDSEGRMLSGWVAYTESNGDYVYTEIDGEDDVIDLTYWNDGDGKDAAYFYCGDEDDGHVKKNKWIKTWRPEDTYDEDDDDDKFWYWIDKNGEVYVPSDSNATGTKYKLTDATLELKASDIRITKKKVNSKDYFFNQNGEMLSHFIEVTPNSGDDTLYEGMYYFGGDDDGSMKTGSQSIKDDNGDTYKFYFGTKSNNTSYDHKGVGITGNKNNKLYYKGLLVTADDYKYQMVEVPDLDGTEYTFIVNKNGSIQHGTVEYKEDSDVLIDTSAKDADGKYLVKYNTDAAQWKYSIKADTIDDIERNVEKIDIYDVMPR